MSLKQALARTLERIRNPKYDENEKAFEQHLGFIRLLIFLPFLIGAILLILLALN